MQQKLLNFKIQRNTPIIIESKTGTGKTLIVPAIFMQRAILGTSPKYFVMTQPSFFDVNEKHAFFHRTLWISSIC